MATNKSVPQLISEVLTRYEQSGHTRSGEADPAANSDRMESSSKSVGMNGGKGSAEKQNNDAASKKESSEKGPKEKVLPTVSLDILNIENFMDSEKAKLSFPERLMDLLEDESLSKAIFWIPGIDAFALVPKIFYDVVLVEHFQSTRYESFTRKLNRWGFKRLTGRRVPPNCIGYYHSSFKKGQPELLKMIRSGSYSSDILFNDEEEEQKPKSSKSAAKKVEKKPEAPRPMQAQSWVKGSNFDTPSVTVSKPNPPSQVVSAAYPANLSPMMSAPRQTLNFPQAQNSDDLIARLAQQRNGFAPLSFDQTTESRLPILEQLLLARQQPSLAATTRLQALQEAHLRAPAPALFGAGNRLGGGSLAPQNDYNSSLARSFLFSADPNTSMVDANQIIQARIARALGPGRPSGGF